MIASNYDVIFFGIIIFSAFLALIRGAISELLSLSVWFLAFIVMRNYSAIIDKHIPPNISNPLLRSAIVFIAAFIVIAIVVAIVKRIFSTIIKSIGLGGLNYLLGAVFGALRGILICALLIILVEITKFDQSHAWKKSKLNFILIPTVEWITNAIPEQIKELPKPPVLMPG